MQKYNSYKNSGIQWLGEIPSHWECVRVKALFDNIREKNNPVQTEERLSLSIDKGVTLYSEKTTNLDRFKEDFTQYLLAHPDDIVLNSMNMIVGAVGKSKYFGCVSPAYYVIRLKNPENQINYYAHLLNIQKIRDVYRIMGKGIMAIDRGDGKVNTCRLKVPYDSFGSIKIPLPPLAEQHSIVAYLDSKCALIDKMLANKQRQIELLSETKQRTIADAVTRGIDKNIKLKKTNIQWLKEIPENWEEVKLKMLCKENKEKNKDNKETCVLSLSYGKIIVKQNINFGLVPENYTNYQIVYPDYIILRLTDLQNDHRSLRTGLVKDKGIITSAYVGLIVSNANSEYIQLLLHAYDVMKVFYGMGGGLRQSMNYNDVANLYIPLPPLAEQRAIVAYINDRVTKIDALAAKLQQEIDNIKEYKQRLISDVVTGSIKV